MVTGTHILGMYGTKNMRILTYVFSYGSHSGDDGGDNNGGI